MQRAKGEGKGLGEGKRKSRRVAGDERPLNVGFTLRSAGLK
jgi:hypothetical protein